MKKYFSLDQINSKSSIIDLMHSQAISLKTPVPLDWKKTYELKLFIGLSVLKIYYENREPILKKPAFIFLIFILVTETYASGFIKATGGLNLLRYSGVLGNDVWKIRTGYVTGIGKVSVRPGKYIWIHSRSEWRYLWISSMENKNSCVSNRIEIPDILSQQQPRSPIALVSYIEEYGWAS